MQHEVDDLCGPGSDPVSVLPNQTDLIADIKQQVLSVSKVNEKSEKNWLLWRT